MLAEAMLNEHGEDCSCEVCYPILSLEDRGLLIGVAAQRREEVQVKDYSGADIRDWKIVYKDGELRGHGVWKRAQSLARATGGALWVGLPVCTRELGGGVWVGIPGGCWARVPD